MRVNRKRKATPLKEAIRCFIAGVIFAVTALFVPLDTVSCSNEGYGQACIHYIFTYDGIDGHTFKVVLGAIAILCFVGGMFYINRHKKVQAERNSGTAFSTLRPVAPQQPGAYPLQQYNLPESYTGDAQSLSSSDDISQP